MSEFDADMALPGKIKLNKEPEYYEITDEINKSKAELSSHDEDCDQSRSSVSSCILYTIILCEVHKLYYKGN